MVIGGTSLHIPSGTIFVCVSILKSPTFLSTYSLAFFASAKAFSAVPWALSAVPWALSAVV